MLFPSVPKVGLLALTVSSIVVVASAYDISAPKDPVGPLKVALDYSVARGWPTEFDDDAGARNTKRNWQFSSHIVFAGRVGDSDESNPPISDGQLWQIAKDAADEMIADATQYAIGRSALPTAVGILAWGNEIILASSIKYAGSFSYEFLKGDTPVGQSLQQCQLVWRETRPADADKDLTHHSGANCAEPMAAHLYYKINKSPLNTRKARVGTWVWRSKKWQQTDPCGTNTPDYWGCNLFTKNQGLRVLDASLTPEPYTLSEIAGGPIHQNQIQMCGGDVRVFKIGKNNGQ